MSNKSLSIASAIALGASAAALAQTATDRSFTATGSKCEDVTWSQKALTQYPRIADACQSVKQRDGKYYVVFSGTVRTVANSGRSVTIDFQEGDRLTINPPENQIVEINGKATPMRDLRRGDVLTFYVPQDQLVAQFPEGTSVSPPIRITQWAPERVALVPHATTAASAPQLPKTASELPAVGLCGLLLIAVGAALTTLRRLRRAQ